MLFVSSVYLEGHGGYFTGVAVTPKCPADPLGLLTATTSFSAEVYGFDGTDWVDGKVRANSDVFFHKSVSGSFNCDPSGFQYWQPFSLMRTVEALPKGKQNLSVAVYITIDSSDFSFTERDQYHLPPKSSPLSYAFDTMQMELDVAYTEYMGLFLAVRYLCIATLVYHWRRFARALKCHDDPLRLEHRVGLVGFFFMILAMGPFSGLTLLPNRTGNVKAIALLVFQVPQIAVQFLTAAIYTVVRDISKRASEFRKGRTLRAAIRAAGVDPATLVERGYKEQNPRSWMHLWLVFTVLAVLQVLLVWTTGDFSIDMTSVGNDLQIQRGNFGNKRIARVGIFAVYGIVNIWCGLRVILGLFGGFNGWLTLCCYCWVCCGRCNVKQKLRAMLYFPTRDRQLLVRFFRVFVIIAMGYYATRTISSVTESIVKEGSEASGIGVTSIILMTLGYHILIYALTPVFNEKRSGHEHAVIPPTPVNDAWKRMRWPDAAVDRNTNAGAAGQWLRCTPGALTLYQLATLEEEANFRALNLGSLNHLESVNFFNYEVVLCAMHFSTEAYRLEYLSPAASSVVAALAVVSAAEHLKHEEVPEESGTGAINGGDTVTRWERNVNIDDLARATLKERMRAAMGRARVSVLTVGKGGGDGGKSGDAAKDASGAPSKKTPMDYPTSPDGKFMYTLLHVSNLAYMQVTYIRWQGKFVITFRGSSNISNWKSDLNMPRVLWQEMDGAWQMAGIKTSCFRSDKPLVHRGFANLWAKIKPTVMYCLQTLRKPNEPVLVTGHSLGGAMATLSSYSIARYLQTYDRALLDVVSFGGPLVGNEVFVRLYNNVVQRHLRIVNKNDLITWATVPFQKNMHVGKLVFIADDTGMLSIEPTYYESWFSPKANLYSPCGLVDTGLFHLASKYKTALSGAFDSHRTRESSELVPSWAREEIPCDEDSGCCL
eukprot:TRINITY_DN1269_c0_g1_i11.p1 TRINITY_DN1269_c0_g1~~TRINITY_DN1269_c0_g1_i11.p1  ORF type:complete len:1054 (+),score=400.17 TRINITY_DN1269_c0_g1_i11:345-3164(+)